MWEIFHDASELAPEDRPVFLDGACGDDDAMRQEVESLLESQGSSLSLPTPEAILGMSLPDDELEVAAPGDLIGPYRILREVGQGGMGVVYEAEQQEPVRRRVALKLIRLGMDTAQVVARFEAERQALAMMNHPCIARVLDAGATASGRPYFVMEFVDGEPLTSYCDARRLRTGDRLELFLAVCSGVQHAHQKGIIHRDLKPGNVLVAEQDGKPVPKIIDFGIAKAVEQRLTEKTLFTHAGVLMGTPEYMSPEQAGQSGMDVDTRTDVYSLGVLLYELLVGALPFDPQELRRAGYDEIRRRIREDEPPRPSTRLSTLTGTDPGIAERRRTDAVSLARRLRGDLDWITMKALEKSPDQRYPSPSELAADVRRHLQEEPVLAGPPTASYRLRKFVRRHKVAVAAGSAVAIALVVGMAAASFGLVRARAAERQAREEARTAQEISGFLAGLFRGSEPSARDVDSVTAREILDRGVKRIESDLETEPELRSRLMAEMGSVYAQLGLNPEAEGLFESALEIRRGLPGATDAQLAGLLDHLGSVRHQMGRHQEALPLLEEAATLWERSHGPRDLRVGQTLRNLSGVHQSLGDYGKALEVARRAHGILVETLGPRDPEVGRILRNMGIAYWSLNDYEKALPLYEEALALFEDSLGPDHPDASYVVNSLAILYWNLERYDEARPMFQRTLDNLRRTLGPEHPNTASAMNNLGRLLLDMGLPAEARPHLTESLRIREEKLGGRHPEVATSLVNLGRLQMAEGDLEAARGSFRLCLEIREEALGPDHPHVASTLEVYAELLRRLQEPDRAAELEARARAIREARQD